MLNNIQISKELLNEVLGYKDEDYIIVATEKDIFLDKNYLHFEYQDPYCTMETYTTIKDKINIYELAYKCKKWAFKQGYIISELGKYVLVIKNGITIYRIENDFYETDDLNWDDTFDVRNVFKTCEWILKEIKK